MLSTINIFIILFILISPMFNGLYFETQFNISTIVILTLLLIQIGDKIRKKEKFFLGDKKILVMLGLALLVNISTYILNRIFLNSYYDYKIIFYGITQMLEMILFYFVIIQDRNKEFLKIQNYSLILSGVIMTMLALLPEYYRNGRFEGLFYYANSLAVFLFIGFAITMKTKMNKVIKIIALLILSIGILLTNSRFTYLIYLTYLLIELCIYIKKKYLIHKNAKKYLKLGIYITVFLTAIFCLYVSNSEKVQERFAPKIIMRDINLKLSYFEEASQIIKEHPFGLGYEGYISNQMVKENKYRLRLVHNFLYQWGLNYGIGMLILGITLILYYIKLCIKSEKIITYENLIIILVMFHSLQDISLSFLTIDNIIIMLCVRNIYDENKQ